MSPVTSTPGDRVPAPDEVVRVPIQVLRPSLVGFGKAVWNFGSGATGNAFVRRLRNTRGSRADRGARPDVGEDDVADPGHSLLGITPMTFAPVALKDSGAAWVFDRHGVRVEGSAQISFALPWHEVDRVALQLVEARRLGMQVLQVALWPAAEQTFLAAHPECGPGWDADMRAVVVAVCKAVEVPQESTTLTLSGLAHAGGRFGGELERIVRVD